MFLINKTGNPDYYDKSSNVDFSQANLDAIDSSNASLNLYPYAQSATVQEDHDDTNLSILGSYAMVAGQKIAFGLFLTPDNEKGSLMFHGDIAVEMNISDANVMLYGIYGRTNASAVVSSVVGNENLLSTYRYLRCNHSDMTNTKSLAYNGQIFSDNEEAGGGSGYNHVLGFVIENHSGGTPTIVMRASMAFKKHGKNLSYYDPIYN